MNRASKALVKLRIVEILRIRNDGAAFWDVREYVRDEETKPGSLWELKGDATPLSDGQIRRYIQWADRAIALDCRASRKQLMRRHVAQRRNLFARALSAGDYRAALACADSEAKLLGIGQAEEVMRMMREIREEMRNRKLPQSGEGGAGNPGGTAGPNAEGPGRPDTLPE